MLSKRRALDCRGKIGFRVLHDERGASGLSANQKYFIKSTLNFLFDKSQTPHLRADVLCALCGVSTSSGANKAKLIRDILKMHSLDPDWCLSSLVDKNPLVWMLQVNGLIVDIRRMPREVQEIAYEKGLIPYIPADRS